VGEFGNSTLTKVEAPSVRLYQTPEQAGRSGHPALSGRDLATVSGILNMSVWNHIFGAGESLSDAFPGGGGYTDDDPSDCHVRVGPMSRATQGADGWLSLPGRAVPAHLFAEGLMEAIMQEKAAPARSAIQVLSSPPGGCSLTYFNMPVDALILPVNQTSGALVAMPRSGLALHYNATGKPGPHAWSVDRLTLTFTGVGGACRVNISSWGFTGPSGYTSEYVDGTLSSGETLTLVINAAYLNYFGRSIVVQRVDGADSSSSSQQPCVITVHTAVHWAPYGEQSMRDWDESAL
jgi:hypothetical protein